jgi:hypothetical protein
MAISTIGTNSLSDPIAVNGYTPTASNMQPFNRIINGAMTIDQRNAGASVATSSSTQYTVDRWQALAVPTTKYTVQQNAGAVTPPVGFTNYLGATSTSEYSVVSTDRCGIRQFIEGYNVADLGWGTANAQPVTISFWVRSSLTGTFGGSVGNDAGNRNYPFSYAINAANTWEQKSVTIAGDTTGTWDTTTATGINLIFGLGVGSTYSDTAGAWSSSLFYSSTGAVSVIGTNGATWYITGVQLEAGSTASSFAHENYGDTLQKCQRYYYQIGGGGGEYGLIGIASRWDLNTVSYVGINHPQPMRGVPSLSYTGDIYLSFGGTGTLLTSLGAGYYNRENFRLWQQFNHGAIGSQGQCGIVYCQASSGFLKFDAEL